MTGGKALRGLVAFVLLAAGWQRALIALGAGALSSLAMAPFNAWPILFVTFPIAVWLIDGSEGGRGRGVPAAAWAGWLFGFGYFVPGLYWIGYAFLVDADTFGWLLPVAVSGLPAYLALFTAFGFALARVIWPHGAARVLSLAANLTVAEWLRGHVLTGFPWNAFGYAFAEPLALAQSFSLVGLWGMTFLTVLIAASPALVADSRARFRLALPAAALALLVVMIGFGAWRLQRTPTQFVDGPKLRIMQPNLQQDVKFNYGAKADVMRKYLALSDRATGPQSTGVGDATLLIWPESAFPFFLSREADAMAQIAAMLPAGTRLVTGSVRAPDGPLVRPVTQAYNSIYAIDHDGTVLSIYDKLHLVPFGEYLPSVMEKLGFEQLTKMRGGFLAGDRRRLMEIPGMPPVLPLICYEAIFPSDSMTSGERPGLIVNLTNDAWFGISTGPYQHLQQTRMRAIEQGLPVVRAANSGISAVIDPLGRLIARLDLGTEGVVDARLPRANASTAYARYGDSFAVAFVLIGFLVPLFVGRSGRRRTRS